MKRNFNFDKDVFNVEGILYYSCLVIDKNV